MKEKSYNFEFIKVNLNTLLIFKRVSDRNGASKAIFLFLITLFAGIETVSSFYFESQSTLYVYL